MKHSKLEIFMIFVALAVGLTFGFAWYQASAHDRRDKTESVIIISESIHITRSDGVKSLGQLIREQSGIQIPNRPLLKIHFIVDPFNDSLIFPRNDFQPEGFIWGVLPGQDKTLLVPELPVSASQALDLSPAKTDGVCNFIVQFEFGPKTSKR